MDNMNWSIGVCSWSLQAGVDEVAAAMKEIGIGTVHLSVGEALGDEGKAYLDAVKKQDWVISSTMIGFDQEDYSTLNTIKATGGVLPDDSWEKNKGVFEGAAKVTKELGVKYISTHAGFIDHTDKEKYQVMCDRVKCLADISADNGLMLLAETGQETAADLAGFLDDVSHPAIGINFDPANMILYAKGDPIEALKILAKQIKHVHIKDALKSETAGEWGTEVPWGNGQVGSVKFLDTLKSIGYEGAIVVEREAGDQRKADIALAVERIREYMGRGF